MKDSMSNPQCHVLLIDGDPLVLEGMKLLLQDFHCEVTLIREQRELRTLGVAHPDCPRLIIVPKMLESGTPGERLIYEIRAHYRASIPAIVLATDHSFNTEPVRQDNILILTDGLNPKRLRNMITELLEPAKASKSD
jgi:DNA-binding NtrC family response regulator